MPIDWRRRERAARFDHGAPIRFLSFAPVAGVMLVAVVLMTMSVPASIHALTFDLYGSEFYGADNPAPAHRIDIDEDGAISWNRQQVTLAELGRLLRESVAAVVEPKLIFAAHDLAPYGRVALALHIVKVSGIREFCVEGLERNRQYEQPLAGSPAEAGPENCDFFAAAPPGWLF